MASDISDGVVGAVRELYRSSEDAQALFDWMAARERDAAATSIDRISERLRISRGEAVALARALEEAGCGQFIVGRRGQKSRFSWEWNCISLGQAASGEEVTLEPPESGGDEDVEPTEAEQANPFATLTLAQAKVAMAAALGVPVENIEITIKA